MSKKANEHNTEDIQIPLSSVLRNVKRAVKRICMLTPALYLEEGAAAFRVRRF